MALQALRDVLSLLLGICTGDKQAAVHLQASIVSRVDLVVAEPAAETEKRRLAIVDPEPAVPVVKGGRMAAPHNSKKLSTLEE